MKPQPSLLASHIAWFNASTWLERLWHRSWWEYLDHSTLTETDGGDRDGHNQQQAAQENQ